MSAAIPLAISVAASAQSSRAGGAIESYYSIRNTPLWFVAGNPTPAASVLVAILRRARLDGVPDGERLATQVERAIQTVRQSPGSAMQMDRVLSSAWVRYVQAIEAPVPAMHYGDDRTRSVESPAAILTRAAETQTEQLQHVFQVASVNPLYARLRDAVWNEMKLAGTRPSGAALANLSRLRMLAPTGRYLIVDTRAAMLYMFNGDELVDSMRVVTGKPATPTPLVASMIYFVTSNPYWNVPASLVQTVIASRVVAQGSMYLKSHHYQVVTKYGADASELQPETVDWKAVANGTAEAMVRQLPGPLNSMGTLKVGFPNAFDIYLHDTPNKRLFQETDRLLSNGCIRLQDAQRLGRWLVGRELARETELPEVDMWLPYPVPIYVTYVTMAVANGRPNFVGDPYGWDPVEDNGTSKDYRSPLGAAGPMANRPAIATRYPYNR
jgi:murein L,D-transpeptidase YcbB/YkuD